MRKLIAVLLFFALALGLTGCGPGVPKSEGPLAMDTEGNLGNLRWGMRHADAAYADSRIVFDGSSNARYDSCVVEFLGRKWRMKLYYRQFYPFPEKTERLYRYTLDPLEDGGSWEELVEPLEAMLGPRNLRERARNGLPDEWEELPEWAWAWHSELTLGDRVSREAVEQLYSNPIQAEDMLSSFLSGVCFQYGGYSCAWYGEEGLPADVAVGLPRIMVQADAAVMALLLGEKTE